MNGNEIEWARDGIDENTVAACIWRREDFASYLEDHDIPATKANLEALLTPRFIDQFNCSLNESGYDIMEALIDADELPDKAE